MLDAATQKAVTRAGLGTMWSFAATSHSLLLTGHMAVRKLAASGGSTAAPTPRMRKSAGTFGAMCGCGAGGSVVTACNWMVSLPNGYSSIFAMMLPARSEPVRPGHTGAVPAWPAINSRSARSPASSSCAPAVRRPHRLGGLVLGQHPSALWGLRCDEPKFIGKQGAICPLHCHRAAGSAAVKFAPRAVVELAGDGAE